MTKNKSGLSPVVATVLLVAMVIVIGIIIFLWFRGFTQESITKFGGRNVELVCADVNFQATYSGGVLSVTNIGNVPIYSMVLKISEQGRERSVNLNDISGLGWPDKGLIAGTSFSGNINSISNNPLEITLIPVLIGTSSEGGEKTYVCNERQYGKQIL